MSIILFIVNGIMFLFNGTPKKSVGEQLQEASRILRAEHPEPYINRTVDENKGLSDIDRLILFGNERANEKANNN
jgi:hypothetical protein